MRRLALIAVALGLSAGCGQQGAKPSDAPAETRHAVEVTPVVERRLERRIVADGALEAFETIHLSARVGGVIEQLLVAEGDHVRAGDAVAEIEPDRYRLAVASAEAAAARADATRADAAAELARREELAKAGPSLIKKEELEQARARAGEADADLASAKAALERARLDLRDARVVAPADGVIQARLAESGQYAQPGMPIATLVRLEPLRLRFAVSPEDARLLSVGQTATFRARGADGEAVATISFIAAQAEAASRQVTVIATVAARPDLRPGAYADIAIDATAPTPLPAVPETAVRPSERGFLAYVVETRAGERVARERKLRLGMRSRDGQVEVREGLEAGESVVVRGAEALAEGAPVRVVEAARPEAPPAHQ